MSFAIDINGVSKTYTSKLGLLERLRGKTPHQHQALKPLELHIEQGEFFGLLGHNGAGKTTLISILAGLIPASTGSAQICGFDVTQDFHQARHHVGIVPQEIAYDPFFTVREVLRQQSGYYGLRKNDDWIDELLARFELVDKANVRTSSLSGGMKRRLMVMQALVHKPPVIVLDEPTAGVDVDLRLSLWAFIRDLHAQGHTMVLTTHYLEEAQALCDRIGMLKSGQLQDIGSPQALMQRYHANNLEEVFLAIMHEGQETIPQPMPNHAAATLQGMMDSEEHAHE